LYRELDRCNYNLLKGEIRALYELIGTGGRSYLE
jgi:hypothetical protein